MNVGKSFHEVYRELLTVEDHPKYAKHTIAAMVRWVFEELESSGREVTPESIEEVLKKEFSHFVEEESSEKAS